MGARIFFAWVERHETAFTAEHERIDEEVFALHRSLDEGEFPSLEVDVWNEGVGFLAPGRRQWVWVSYERGAGDVVPLFFGRIVGVPQQFSEDMVRLTFRARPQDYEDRKEEIAAQHRELPVFDPVWMSEAERRDPDAILEAQSKLWWVDPVSHEVALSDIVTGEAGTLVFTADMVDDDTLQMSYSRPPARRANVEAAVRWTQAGRDEIDLTPALQAAFGTVTPAHSVSIDGEEFPTAGLVCLAAGEEMMRAWPDTGTAIGGGWSVGTSIIGRIDRQPAFQIVSSEATWSRVLDNSINGHQASKINFGSGGALIGPVQQGPGNLPAGPFDPPPEIVWVPIWTMFAQLGAVWEASRNREETIRFTIEADVQPVLVDDGAHDSDHIDLSFGPTAVDAPLGEDPWATEPTAATASEPHVTAGPIGDLRRRSYFKTTRGRMSFEHVLLRARAALLDRARCVDVVFETGFEEALEVTTRHSVTLIDDGEGSRIPGGQVTGKVVHASLTVDGRTGAFSARIMLGCTAGRSGEVIVEPVIGAPTYAEEGYGETGYEVHAGAVHVPPAGDIGYEDYTDEPIDDDGIDLTRISRQDYLAGISIEGGLVKEMEQVDTPDAIAPGGWLHQPWNPAHSPYQLVERIRAVETTIRLEMVPVTGGPFHTVIEPEVGTLKVPRLVDLEAAAATG